MWALTICNKGDQQFMIPENTSLLVYILKVLREILFHFKSYVEHCGQGNKYSDWSSLDTCPVCIQSGCVGGLWRAGGALPNHIELVLYRKAVVPEEREKMFLSNEKIKFQNLSFLVI